jgi:hypothetical protein
VVKLTAAAASHRNKYYKFALKLLENKKKEKKRKINDPLFLSPLLLRQKNFSRSCNSGASSCCCNKFMHILPTEKK